MATVANCPMQLQPCKPIRAACAWPWLPHHGEGSGCKQGVRWEWGSSSGMEPWGPIGYPLPMWGKLGFIAILSRGKLANPTILWCFSPQRHLLVCL